MLRTLLVLLLLANALFFAFGRGWLGAPPRQAEREPERLAAQVRPETLRLLPPVAASAAARAAQAAQANNSVGLPALQCLEAGPLAELDLAAAEGALQTAQLPEGSWARIDPAAASAAPAAWLVYAGRYPDPALRSAREEDLRRQRLPYELINAPADLAPGFVLSRHASRGEAQGWLDSRAPAGLRGVRLVQLPAAAPGLRLRVARADADTAERLKALPPAALAALAGGFRPCGVARP